MSENYRFKVLGLGGDVLTLQSLGDPSLEYGRLAVSEEGEGPDAEITLTFIDRAPGLSVSEKIFENEDYLEALNRALLKVEGIIDALEINPVKEI